MITCVFDYLSVCSLVSEGMGVYDTFGVFRYRFVFTDSIMVCEDNDNDDGIKLT